MAQSIPGRWRCLATALCLVILCRPVFAQDPPQQTPLRDPDTSTSASAYAHSSNPQEDAQAPPATASRPDGCDASQLGSCLKDVLHDQAGIWTSPLRLHPRDALWLLPLAGAIAVSMHYDVQTLQQVSTSPSRIRISGDFSNAGTYGAIGAAGAAYLIGKITRKERPRKVGVLALEAVADAGLLTEALKLATNRERPDTGTGRGRFWPDDSDSYTFGGAFPSGHATVIWAFSHVLVKETPGHRWLHLGLYALASGVSVARVTSRNHFPSDVVAGSAIGYLVGGYVDRQHSELSGGNNFLRALAISPIHDPFTRSYGLRVTFDPRKLLNAERPEDEEVVIPETALRHP